MKNILRSVPICLFLLVSNNAIIPDLVTAQVNRAYFSKSPRLISASATFNGVRVRHAKYYFNIEIPDDVGNNLQQIKIAQRKGQETIDFNLDETVAYFGTNRKKQEPIAIASTEQDETTGEITITLEQAIPPDNIFTVGLKPKHNPHYDGVYLFGVKVLPEGINPQSLYLGVGRFHFYRGDDGFFHP